MHGNDVLHGRPHWWIAFMAYSTVLAVPAFGGRFLPLSSEEPLDPGERGLLRAQWTRIGVGTPMFETKEDAEQWIAAFKEHHPEVPELWDKLLPVKMAPRQIQEALLRFSRLELPPPSYHIIPIPVTRQVADEFFAIYHEGFMRDKNRGDVPAQTFATQNQGLAPNKEIG